MAKRGTNNPARQVCRKGIQAGIHWTTEECLHSGQHTATQLLTLPAWSAQKKRLPRKPLNRGRRNVAPVPFPGYYQ